MSAGLASSAVAQVTPPASPAAAAATAAPQGFSIFSMLGLSHENLAACKAKICASPAGKLLNNMLKPVSAMSGGLIGGCCPDDAGQAALEAAKADPDGAGAAAAAIQKDEAEAKARAIAVRYLGTVDCHYWPEAGEGLIKALRGDRNACVRLEAARALGRGCCCTKLTMAALVLTINGSSADSSPSETSERVKAAAAEALAHCLSCYNEVKPGAGPSGSGDGRHVNATAAKKEAEVVQKKSRALDLKNPPVYVFDPEAFAAYYKKVGQLPLVQVVEAGRKTLSKVSSPIPAAAIARGNTGNSVLEVVSRAMRTSTTTTTLGNEPASDTVAAVRPVAAGSGLKTVSYQFAGNGAPAKKQAASEPSAVRTHHEMLALLRESIYQETREWAAENLVHFDWKISPEIVETLVTSASNDKVATVRVACIRCLVKMSVNTGPVVAALQALTHDDDVRVRMEAEQAIPRLTSGKFLPVQ
jgi:hypothetical protein